MNKFYASLVGPLCGYYLEVRAEKKETVRAWAVKTLGKMYCETYEPAYLEKQDHFELSNVIGKTVHLTIEDDVIYENYC